MEIMRFKNFTKKYLSSESFKEVELDRILGKISSKDQISNIEKEFLDEYDNEDNMRDFLYLSKNSTYEKIKFLIENGKLVICDLFDRNGKIGTRIKDIENKFTEEKCKITLRNNEICYLEDKFLYNIIYNVKKNEYSLQVQDEYYEKIPVNNEN